MLGEKIENCHNCHSEMSLDFNRTACVAIGKVLLHEGFIYVHVFLRNIRMQHKDRKVQMVSVDKETLQIA